MKKLSKYKMNGKNPRIISDKDFEALKKNVQEFEKMMSLRPIIVDRRNVIIGGNSKYQALIALGRTEVPDDWIKCANDLTEEERRRFIMLDNHHAGRDDWEVINTDWDISELVNWGIDVPAMPPPGQNVNFTASEKTGLRLRVTFQNGDQCKQFMDLIEKLGITDYKLR